MKRYLVNKYAVNDWSRKVYLWPIWTGFIRMKMSNQRSFHGEKRTRVNTERIIFKARFPLGII